MKSRLSALSDSVGEGGGVVAVPPRETTKGDRLREMETTAKRSVSKCVNILKKYDSDKSNHNKETIDLVNELRNRNGQLRGILGNLRDLAPHRRTKQSEIRLKLQQLIKWENDVDVLTTALRSILKGGRKRGGKTRRKSSPRGKKTRRNDSKRKRNRTRRVKK